MRTTAENTVAELLYRLAEHAETTSSFPHDPWASGHGPGRRRTWTVGLAAALVIGVTFAGASLVSGPTGDRPVATGGDLAQLPGGVTEALAETGLNGRSDASSVWTGRELLVWGGLTLKGSENRWLADGAALDPVANGWRALPPAPIGPRSGAATVWTGSEMLVWGGYANSAMLSDGAAFNPQTNRWRAIASSAFAGAARPAAVWTGTEMLVISSMNTPPTTTAYNPRTDRWRRLAPPPGSLVVPYPQVVWTGTEAYVLLSPNRHQFAGDGSTSPPPTVVDNSDRATAASPPSPPGTPPLPPVVARDPAGGPNSGMFLASYSPESDQWSRPPAIALDVSGLPRLAWTGREILVLQRSLPSGAFEPKRQEWRSLTTVPNASSSFGARAVWTGHLVLLWGGGEAGLAYDPDIDAWWTFDGGGLRSRDDAVVAWTDGLFVGWGGSNNHDDGSGRLENDGIRYRPPSR